jgi:hypothetical protein
MRMAYDRPAKLRNQGKTEVLKLGGGIKVWEAYPKRLSPNHPKAKDILKQNLSWRNIRGTQTCYVLLNPQGQICRKNRQYDPLAPIVIFQSTSG